MGLSNENQNPNTTTTDDYRGELAVMQTRRIASKLIKYEHNPDPRELPNPALTTTPIRTKQTLIPMRVRVDASCADHNSRVSAHGAVEIFAHTWRGRS